MEAILGTILDWIRHLGRTTSQTSCLEMACWCRVCTAMNEASRNMSSPYRYSACHQRLTSGHKPTPVRPCTDSCRHNDHAPRRRIQPEPQAQAPAANSNSPRAWCTPRAGHSRSPSPKVRALALPPRPLWQRQCPGLRLCTPWMRVLKTPHVGIILLVTVSNKRWKRI